MQEEFNLPVTPERVELSGWDISGKFFLESARLISLTNSELFAELKPKVHLGSLVFVRLLDWTKKDDDLPAVYRVKAVEGGGPNDRGFVRLALMKPARPFPQLARMRP